MAISEFAWIQTARQFFCGQWSLYHLETRDSGHSMILIPSLHKVAGLHMWRLNVHVNKGFEMLIETQVPFFWFKDGWWNRNVAVLCDVVQKEMKGPMLHPSSDLYFSYWTLVDHPLGINYSWNSADLQKTAYLAFCSEPVIKTLALSFLLKLMPRSIFH